MHTLVIAEAGVNHNGSYAVAEKLIQAAKDAGADVVKFQTFVPELCVTSRASKADYQKRTTGAEESQLDMVKKLALPLPDFCALKQKCGEAGVRFLSTAFDLPSVAYLHAMGETLWKIPSGEITNLPYLLKIASYHDPVLLSTGMSALGEVERAVRTLQNNGCGAITLLHCTSEYPAPYADVNLRAMETLRKTFRLPVGYSDHTRGVEVAVAAAALGATVIEKHFTLDRTMEGPDHKASLEPGELTAMVAAIRNVEAAMGDGEKRPAESERKVAAVARKSIVAARAIRRGEVLSEENITVKRPGTGISPMEWFAVLGTRAVRDFEEDELIER